MEINVCKKCGQPVKASQKISVSISGNTTVEHDDACPELKLDAKAEPRREGVNTSISMVEKPPELRQAKDESSQDKRRPKQNPAKF